MAEPKGWVALGNAYQGSGNASGAAYASSKVLTDVSPGGKNAGSALVIPASSLIVGNVFRFTAMGTYSTKAEVTKAVLGIYFGGVAGTALVKTGELALEKSAKSWPWMLQAIARVTAVGVAGVSTGAKFITEGFGHYAVAATGLASSTFQMPGESATGGEVTELSSGVSNIVTLGAEWKTEGAENTLTCYQWLVESLN
ncbi:MAG TPA: hypothetical protein VK756_07775 [Solirubrobacteraceae bacterium]|jgi:hypothetical protein|nr:hypothetical protein [Solirubrobacteraceae bacterium]